MWPRGLPGDSKLKLIAANGTTIANFGRGLVKFKEASDFTRRV